MILDRRYLRVFAAWATLLATITGAAVTAEAGSSLAKFGGLDYVPRVCVLSVVRELGPSVATTASLFALVTWAHPFSFADVHSRLRRAVPGALLLALISLPAVLSLALASGFLTGWALFGIRWSTFYAGATKILLLDDLVATLAVFTVGAVIVGVMAWVILQRFAHVKWSLMRKIASLALALIALRLLVAGVGAMA